MMNYLVIDEGHIQMEQGIFGDVLSFHKFPSGELESIMLSGKNMIMTHVGELVPAYTETPRRKDIPSVEFYKSGMIKAVMLEEQVEIETPIGTLPAERVTFYPTGELHRLFVVNGKISGFWSEEEEKQMNIPLTFEFDFGRFTSYINGICFYESGAIKSISLFPGERVRMQTPAGDIETQIGFSLYETGELASIEPAEPILINTSIGQMEAFDTEANGVHADSNSLHFNQKGILDGISTVANRIVVQTEEEGFLIYSPPEQVHPLYDDEMVRKPLRIKFDFAKNSVQIIGEETKEFLIERTHFNIQRLETEGFGCSPTDCASCSLCATKNATE